jgi:uncharacterized protein (UPF0332 family)
MMINSFENYLKFGKAKRKTPDPQESESLIKKSINRLEYTKEKTITEKNADFVLEDAYESMREAAQALMSIKGFKPYSHEATISFISDHHKNDFGEADIRMLDHFRQLRNDSVYKAIIITVDDAKSCISFAESFIRKIKLILAKECTK